MGPAMLWEISLLQKCSLQGDSVAKDKGFICPELLQIFLPLDPRAKCSFGSGGRLLLVSSDHHHQILRP